MQKQNKNQNPAQNRFCITAQDRCFLKLIYLFIYWPFFFGFSGPYPLHMEVPRLGVQSELYQLAYAMATAIRDPSRVCDLHHSSPQCQILNPLSKIRNRPATSRFLVGFVNHWATMGTLASEFWQQCGKWPACPAPTVLYLVHPGHLISLLLLSSSRLHFTLRASDLSKMYIGSHFFPAKDSSLSPEE